MGGNIEHQELHFQAHKIIISMQIHVSLIHSFIMESAAILTQGDIVTNH